MDRIGRLLGTYHADPAWKRMAGVAVSANGKAAPVEAKAAPVPPVSFIPRDSHGNTIESPFYLPRDAEQVSRSTAFAAAVYAYAAMTWRAEKYAEPPLYVAELTDDDEYEWQTDHDLAELLDYPHPDLDMGELLYQTRLYRDATGRASWVKDLDRAGRVRRLTPFHGDEFTVERAAGRIFGRFRVRTATGELVLPAERVVYFREPGPGGWDDVVAPLDVALGVLNLGQRATASVKAVLKNALLPSVVIQTDPEWAPDEQEFERFKALIDAYAETHRKGKPFVLTGGGKATVVSLSLKDLLPGEILDRVEANVAAAFRVPPIVLQFLVGLENSPWSQMEEARRSVTQDLLVPMWTRDQKKLTAQLLRAPADVDRQPVDPNPRHYIRFELGEVQALQPDRSAQAETAERMQSYARVRDLRQLAGLEPLDDNDPRNDVIPGLVMPFAPPPQEAAKHAAPPETKADDDAAKDLAWARFDAATKAQEPTWRAAVAAQLERDRDEIARLATEHLATTKQDDPPADAGAFLRALGDYLTGPAKTAWREVVAPLIASTGEAAVRRIATELPVAWDVLQPGLLDYTEREAAWLITQVTDTTRQAVRDALAAGLEAGDGIDALAARIRSSDAAFGPARAELIARTETTRVTNGAQRESLAAYASSEGVTVLKTWLATRDSRTRDEHRALDGTTVGIDQAFPNGLQAPGEPNCRCTLIYSVED